MRFSSQPTLSSQRANVEVPVLRQDKLLVLFYIIVYHMVSAPFLITLR